MNPLDTITQASINAQMCFGYGGMMDGLAGPQLGMFTDLSELVQGTSAGKWLEENELEKAKENTALNYDMEEFEEQTENRYHVEILNLLELIKTHQPHLKLFLVRGEEFYFWQGYKRHVGYENVYRLQAPDGYCFDFSIFDEPDKLGTAHKNAHIKYILQRKTSKQGNGLRMFNFINQCSDLLFRDDYWMLYGWPSRTNDFDVRKNRHGTNWRAKEVQIKDAFGESSPLMTRLLALYLRNGWILSGYQKGLDEEILLPSPDAIRFIVGRSGNKTLEAFKYSNHYEKIVSNYKI